MLHKMSSTASYLDVIQENKISANMAVSRKAVTKNIKKWFKAVIKFTLLSGSLKSLSIEYVNNVHRGISPKNCSRNAGGQSETGVHLQSLEQKMLFNNEWLAFLHNIKMKQHLLNLFLTYLCADDFVQLGPLSIVINNENEIFKIPSK